MLLKNNEVHSPLNDYLFYPIAFKGCAAIVFNYGITLGRRSGGLGIDACWGYWSGVVGVTLT